jgi:7,8-dihydropterin-6-yl-methyl-4-(beta-D-ribofuranosyl)aminobenzene 5'-phosphate synthase
MGNMKVTCVVDDAVQRSSPYWGEHGVAFLVEAESGRLLFDTGQSDTVLLHNLDLLDVEPRSVDAVAISHAHYDHTGGLPMLMEHLDQGTPLYANPHLFRERYAEREGKLESVGVSLTRQAVAAEMFLMLDAEPQEIFPGVWTTGEITERPEIEGSSDYHRMREGDELVADAYLDDMACVLEWNGHAMLLCGCCHAGLLNTLAHAVRLVGRPIEIIAGGLHLTSASEDELRHICKVLAEEPALERIYPNHCTGEAAFVALTNTLGSAVVHPCPAGTVLELPV